MSDKFDEIFGDLPGTTHSRSQKAMKRARRDPVEPEHADPFENIDDPTAGWDADPLGRVTKTGMRIELFSVSALAKAWDARTVQSVRLLERRGVLPRARWRNQARNRKGNRLYSRAQIEAVVRIAKECGVYKKSTRVNIAKSGFPAKILLAWKSDTTVTDP